MKNSNFRFKDFALEFNSFVKVTWNGKVIWDDYVDHDFRTLQDLQNLEKNYANRLVYSMHVTVVEGHHTELIIEGE